MALRLTEEQLATILARSKLLQPATKQRGASVDSRDSKSAGAPRRSRQPNKTERRFRDTYLRDWRPVFEGLRLAYGGVNYRKWYTPDWVTSRSLHGPPDMLWEVKGGHIYPSAKERFCAAAGAWPALAFAMVQWDRGAWRLLMVENDPTQHINLILEGAQNG